MIDKLVQKLIKSDKKVYIQTHDFPDPDAVATAFGLQYYFKKSGITTHLTYCGDIQREALKKMITDLTIDIKPYTEYQITTDDLIIIVDGCKWSKNVTDLPGYEIAVIDHHLVEKPDDVPFVEIKEEIGSCSTIITGYFMGKNWDIPQQQATALKVGISRDTDLLTRKVTRDDVDAYHYLYDYADNDLVNSLLRNNIQLSDFIFFQQTISSLNRSKSLAWYYFEQGCESNLMGILGDFILSAQEIEVSILFAKKDDTIAISIRSERYDCSAAEAVRVMTQNIGAGGGHNEMAGGVIFSAKDFNPHLLIERVNRHFDL